MANGYGTKGGTSATAGRTSEVIEATVFGTTYRKRVFFGQRVITVMQRDENDEPLVQAWLNREQATEYLRGADGDRWPVQMILDASPKA